MLLAILAALLGAEVRQCVYYENDSFTLVPLEDKGHNCVATTISDIEVFNETGWMRFNVTTSASYPDFIQMRAVGFAEGKIFQHHIFNHYHNLKDWFLFAYLHADDYPKSSTTFFRRTLTGPVALPTSTPRLTASGVRSPTHSITSTGW